MDKVYIVSIENDGTYLCDQLGYKATREEIEALVPQVLETARKHEKDIVIHNLSLDRDYGDRLQRPMKKGPAKLKARYVYMFKCGDDRYKIGVSSNVERRRKELDNRPYPVSTYAVSKVPFSRAFEFETYVHDLHSGEKTDGEWFVIDDARAKRTALLIENADDGWFIDEDGE